MKRAIVLFLILLGLPGLSSSAQDGGWCGFVLIEGLPILRNQLSVVEALAPERHERSRPNELFQIRYNLAHTAVLLEACWEAVPTREVLLALLPQTVDDRSMNAKLRVTIFGRGARQEASSELVRQYLAANRVAWMVEENLP